MEEERDSTSIIESKTAPGRDSRQFDWSLSASRQAGTSSDLLNVVLFLILVWLDSCILLEEKQLHRGRCCMEEERDSKPQ